MLKYSASHPLTLSVLLSLYLCILVYLVYFVYIFFFFPFVFAQFSFRFPHYLQEVMCLPAVTGAAVAPRSTIYVFRLRQHANSFRSISFALPYLHTAPIGYCRILQISSYSSIPIFIHTRAPHGRRHSPAPMLRVGQGSTSTT